MVLAQLLPLGTVMPPFAIGYRTFWAFTVAKSVLAALAKRLRNSLSCLTFDVVPTDLEGNH